MLRNCFYIHSKEQSDSSCTEKGRIVLFNENGNTVCLGECEYNFNFGYWWDGTNRGKGSVQDNPVSVSNCPKEFPHGIACDRSRILVVRSLRLTAWNMARLFCASTKITSFNLAWNMFGNFCLKQANILSSIVCHRSWTWGAANCRRPNLILISFLTYKIQFLISFLTSFDSSLLAILIPLRHKYNKSCWACLARTWYDAH